MPSAARKRARDDPQSYPAFVQLLRAEGIASPERVLVVPVFVASIVGTLVWAIDRRMPICSRMG